MVSVRRVAPILLLAVTVPVWAQAPSTTTAKTKSPQKKTTAGTLPPATSTSAATATSAPAATPAPKKAAATPKKKATTKAAAKKETKPAAEKPVKAAAKVSHPPRELHKVFDHWTAYNPPDPASYPAGAKTYTIKPGDTLWALGKQFYGNSYLWPQLWETNTWITDAHWIYPGDVLLVEGEIAQQATTTGAGAAGAAVGGAPSGQPTPAPAHGPPRVIRMRLG